MEASTTITHQLYTELVQTKPAVLEALERLVARAALKRAPTLLAAALQEHSLLPSEPLNYPRLYALLKKNLAGEDLFGEDFCDMTLDEFNFSKAILGEANFMRARLEGANFSDCDLTSARFDHARCCRVNATQADLSYASLVESDWSNANCTRTKLEEVNASGANFLGTTFHEANLCGALLRNADCLGSHWHFCNLALADAQDADFGDAELWWSNVK